MFAWLILLQGSGRSRRSSQASQSTNIELGDNIEVDSKQRMQVIKAANVLKLSEGAGSDDIVSTVNSVIDALEGAGLMKGRGKSF